MSSAEGVEEVVKDVAVAAVGVPDQGSSRPKARDQDNPGQRALDLDDSGPGTSGRKRKALVEHGSARGEQQEIGLPAATKKSEYLRQRKEVKYSEDKSFEREYPEEDYKIPAYPAIGKKRQARLDANRDVSITPSEVIDYILGKKE